MADWMMDTFFIFSGLALLAFVAAWKAGHFHELDKHGRHAAARAKKRITTRPTGRSTKRSGRWGCRAVTRLRRRRSTTTT